MGWMDQPKSQHNYTEIGFKKMKAPAAAWEALMKFYQDNKGKAASLEKWPSPSYMLNLEDRKLRGAVNVKQQIWDGVRPVLEEWTGKKLTETSLYGIRFYHDGAILATHVDRLPLVSSCIIQVDQDLDEPWPVEVYSHDGKAYNVTMEPGDMVLYESHTVLHGRPFPLKGRFYANVFVHYIPVDHDEENEKDRGVVAPNPDAFFLQAAKRQAEGAHQKGIGGHEHDNHDQEAVERHMKRMDEGEPEGEDEEEEEVVVKAATAGRTDLHRAAGKGDMSAVQTLLSSQASELLHAKDANSWQAIHEAARGGHLDVLKHLVDKGADVNAKTSNGGTVLWWAKRRLEAGHSVIEYLESIGASEEGEDL